MVFPRPVVMTVCQDAAGFQTASMDWDGILGCLKTGEAGQEDWLHDAVWEQGENQKALSGYGSDQRFFN